PYTTLFRSGRRSTSRSGRSAAQRALALLELGRVDLATGEALPQVPGVVRRLGPRAATVFVAAGRGGQGAAEDRSERTRTCVSEDRRRQRRHRRSAATGGGLAVQLG